MSNMTDKEKIQKIEDILEKYSYLKENGYRELPEDNFKIVIKKIIKVIERKIKQ